MTRQDLMEMDFRKTLLLMRMKAQGPGHELPDEQPPFTYVDPDNQEFYPKPPNERSIGISSEPDRDLGTEVEV